VDSPIDTAFENWLHGHAPSSEVYEASGGDTWYWSNKELRGLMAEAFEAGYSAAIDMEG
jgi:hypothetical protein